MMEDRSGAVRYRNHPDPQGYMQAMQRVNSLPWNIAGGPVQWVEELDAGTRMRERIMLGLRVAEGVDLGALEQELGVAGWTDRRRRAARWLQAHGRVVVEGDRIRIPRRAWLWEADTVARLL
jgi:oxygen-independent coproporphyrinogen-3 oxidase